MADISPELVTENDINRPVYDGISQLSSLTLWEGLGLFPTSQWCIYHWEAFTQDFGKMGQIAFVSDEDIAAGL